MKWLTLCSNRKLLQCLRESQLINIFQFLIIAEYQLCLLLFNFIEWLHVSLEIGLGFWGDFIADLEFLILNSVLKAMIAFYIGG